MYVILSLLALVRTTLIRIMPKTIGKDLTVHGLPRGCKVALFGYVRSIDSGDICGILLYAQNQNTLFYKSFGTISVCTVTHGIGSVEYFISHANTLFENEYVTIFDVNIQKEFDRRRTI